MFLDILHTYMHYVMHMYYFLICSMHIFFFFLIYNLYTLLYRKYRNSYMKPLKSDIENE